MVLSEVYSLVACANIFTGSMREFVCAFSSFLKSLVFSFCWVYEDYLDNRAH